MRRAHTAWAMFVEQGIVRHPEKPALLQRVVAAPRVVRRTTRRWSHAAGLTANISAALRRLHLLERGGADANTERLMFQRWLANNVCAIHGVEVQASGCVHLLDERSPSIVVANHISYLDPVAILSRLPAFSIAKREVARWPFVGGLATRLGMVPYARGDACDGARVLRRCEAYLDEGHSVLAFPEGTTTRGRTLARFHRGAFYLAQRCGVPVLPIVLRYDCDEAPWVGDEAFVPHYVRTTARPTTRMSMEVLGPMRPRSGESSQDFCARVEAQMHERLMSDGHG